MKAHVVVFVVALLTGEAAAEGGRQKCKGPGGKELPECAQVRKNAQQLKDQCQQQFGLTAEDTEPCEIPDDAEAKENLAKYHFCLMTKIGVIDAEGNLQTPSGMKSDACANAQSPEQGRQGRPAKQSLAAAKCSRWKALEACVKERKGLYGDNLHGRVLLFRMCSCKKQW